MHSSLVVIQKPSSAEDSEMQKWQRSLKTLAELASKYNTIEMLSESCLLVHLENGLHSFALILRVCVESSLQYRVLFFGKAPLWITSHDNFALKDYPDEAGLKSF